MSNQYPTQKLKNVNPKGGRFNPFGHGRTPKKASKKQTPFVEHVSGFWRVTKFI